MQVKLVNGNNKQYFTCSHVGVTVNGPDTLAVREGLASPGIVVELSPGPTLRLPEDGQSVFLINDASKTVDAYHWPPREKNVVPTQHDGEIHSPAID